LAEVKPKNMVLMVNNWRTNNQCICIRRNLRFRLLTSMLRDCSCKMIQPHKEINVSAI